MKSTAIALDWWVEIVSDVIRYVSGEIPPAGGISPLTYRLYLEVNKYLPTETERHMGRSAPVKM